MQHTAGCHSCYCLQFWLLIPAPPLFCTQSHCPLKYAMALTRQRLIALSAFDWRGKGFISDRRGWNDPGSCPDRYNITGTVDNKMLVNSDFDMQKEFITKLSAGLAHTLKIFRYPCSTMGRVARSVWRLATAWTFRGSNSGGG